MLRACTERLQALTKAELEHELGKLIHKQHSLTLERIFIENRVYKKIEDQKTAEGVTSAVVKGMEPFKALFVRELVPEDVTRLLEIPIKRISAFDIEQNRKDIAALEAEIKAVKAKLKDLVGTCIAWLEMIISKYGVKFPRRTKVKGFETVDKKAVANANLRIGYDASTGFIGTAVKAGDRELKISEYDKIIAVMQDGMYRIMGPTEKTVLEGKLIHLDVFDAEAGLTITVVYRDKDREPWGKVTTISSFIKDREYELIKDRAGKIDYFAVGTGGVATLQFAPAKGQRVHEQVVDLATLEPCGVSTRGTKLADKPVQKIIVQKPTSKA